PSCRTARRATATRRASRYGSPPPTRTRTAPPCWCCSTARARLASAIMRAAATSSTARTTPRSPPRGSAGARPRLPATSSPIGSRPKASGRSAAARRPRAVDRRRAGRYIKSDRISRSEGTPMAVERTLSIIKPDATRRNLTDKINARFEQRGLRIIKKAGPRKLSRDEAERFYGVHRHRPFFNDLVNFMTSDMVVIQVLEGENAVALQREIMGATDPAKAAAGTIRKD